MGLENTFEKGTFVTLSKGSFSISAEEGESGAKRIVYKSDDGSEKITYKKYYDTLSGIVTSIGFRETNFGDKFELIITDSEDKYILQMSPDSGSTNLLINFLLNEKLDFEKKIIFKTSEEENNGFKSTKVFVKQLGQNMKGVYHKNDGKLPEVTKGEKRGKVVWDFSAVNNFYYDKVEKELKPRIESLFGSEMKDTEDKESQEDSSQKNSSNISNKNKIKDFPTKEENNNLNEVDDLPF